MIELLAAKNYVVRVYPFNDPESGCRQVYKVDFPKQTLINKEIPDYSITYCISDKGISRHISTGENVIFTEMPSYAMRLYINLDISFVLRNLGLSPKLLYLQDEGGEPTEELIDVVLENEVLKETILNSVFFEAMELEFPKKFDKIAKKSGVLDGYLALKEMFTN